MKSENFEMVAKTFQGLEDVLAGELTRLGAENVTPEGAWYRLRATTRCYTRLISAAAQP